MSSSSDTYNEPGTSVVVDKKGSKEASKDVTFWGCMVEWYEQGEEPMNEVV